MGVGVGAGEALPQKQRGGGGQGFSHAEGGGGGCTHIFELVLIQKLQVLAILKGVGEKSFHPLKGAAQTVLLCLMGGRAHRFRTKDFPFCSPPPRN